MSIPYATTTIRVWRPDPDTEPYEEPLPPVMVAENIRAHISTSSGRDHPLGDVEVVQYRLSADPVDIEHRDQVEDERTGEVFDVVWVRRRVGLGMDHVQAGLRRVDGMTSRPRR